MKLALPLLLAALALCCPDAQAGEVCPALFRVLATLANGPKWYLKEKLSEFDAPAEAMQDTLQVKTCVDKMTKLDKFSLYYFEETVKAKCKKQVS